MQRTMSASPSRLWDICIVVLLIVQGILGLTVSLSQLSRLLAPGSPVIVSGINIFTGPVAGIAFVVAVASLVMTWGWWTRKHWAKQRLLLIECISLAISVIEFVEPHLSRAIPLARIALAIIILLCLYATRAEKMESSSSNAITR